MILSPLQNTGVFLGGQWIQKRPRITQFFGKNPDMYKQFGMLGHNGIDFGIPVGTPLFAVFEGIVFECSDDGSGYGKFIKLRKDNIEVVYGHLSDQEVKKGQKIYMGDKIGESGNTGNSTGPHLHFGLRCLDSKGNILAYNNGYKGYVDPLPFLLTWKGTFLNNSL